MKHTLTQFSNQYRTESHSSKFAEKLSKFYHYQNFTTFIPISIYMACPKSKCTDFPIYELVM